MIADGAAVGFIETGGSSEEARAAVGWLTERAGSVERVGFTDLGTAAVDVAWWHRDAPIEPDTIPDEAPDAVASFLDAGGSLVLSLRAMAGVDDLGIDPVAPDAVGVDGISEPTGVLWRQQYDDHPAVAGFDSLRIPVCDCGAVPTARYEGVLPERGEVLAGTVRGDDDVPDRMTVVSWDCGGGSVLGVGAPLSFHEPAAEPVAENRSRLAAACLESAATGRAARGQPTTAADLRALRRKSTDDHARPEYHFTPPANWLNDPNGLIRWNGRYHLFYQYNPAGPFHNTIHWGHAVSDDLRHWEDRPVALSPAPDGPDRHGCWSGCAVDDDGTATVLYTGGNGRNQLPCLATAADDRLDEWTKDPSNPVIESPPAGLDVLATDHWAAEFRDHGVWLDGDTWYQVIGTGIAGRGGGALLYASSDLRDWEYEGPLLLGDDGDGAVWECPEVLDLDDATLLHVSNYEDVVYFLGDIVDGEFEVDRRGVLDHGDFYAPQSLRDGDRLLTWGWLPETRSVGEQWDAGWSGALSLPRVLSLGDDGRLRQRPAEEVAELRTRRLDPGPPATLDAGERRPLDVAGRRLELHVDVSLTDAAAFELSVLESDDRDERTPIRYTHEDELVVERAESSRRGVGAAGPQRMPVTPYDAPLSLRAFLDRSVIELYANGRHCLTTRVYPGADSTGVSIAAEGGRAAVASLSAWELEPAVADPVSPEPESAGR